MAENKRDLYDRRYPTGLADHAPYPPAPDSLAEGDATDLGQGSSPSASTPSVSEAGPLSNTPQDQAEQDTPDAA